MSETIEMTLVDRVITINDKDFRRIYPRFADKIVSPEISETLPRDTDAEN
jgi:hypothetical protein